jgi:hypothetical protein
VLAHPRAADLARDAIGVIGGLEGEDQDQMRVAS